MHIKNHNTLFSLLLVASSFAYAMDTPKKNKKRTVLSRMARSLSRKPNKRKTKKNVPTFSYATSQAFDMQDIVRTIAQQLYAVSTLKTTCKNMRKFSGINRTTYSCCAVGYTDKDIIRRLAIEHNRSDLDVADISDRKIIADNIWRLFFITKDESRYFTPKDLQDAWYLDATANQIQNYPFKQETLLFSTIRMHDLKKIRVLIEAGADCNSNSAVNPLALMANQNRTYFSYKLYDLLTQRDYLFIITILLEKGIDPDSRCTNMCLTLLHKAAYNDDREIALLALRYGANPYLLFIDEHILHEFNQTNLSEASTTDTLDYYDHNKPWHLNAFALECGEPKGWLKTMYREIQTNKNTQATHLTP